MKKLTILCCLFLAAAQVWGQSKPAPHLATGKNNLLDVALKSADLVDKTCGWSSICRRAFRPGCMSGR